MRNSLYIKILLFFFFNILLISNCLSQQIINAVMVGSNGITDKPKEAKYLVVIKKYNDSAFERLDYNFTGSIISSRRFNDSGLEVLNGRYMEYAPTGYLLSDGQYSNNKKEGDWYLYNDTAHAIAKYQYHLDTLLHVINLDSLDEEQKKIKEDTTGEIEATYVGGSKEIMKIVKSNLQVPERTESLSKGGKVLIRFIIDTTGKIETIEILKSVEFALDEESKRVISLLTNWNPASQKGKKVKAFRIQPIAIQLD